MTEPVNTAGQGTRQRPNRRVVAFAMGRAMATSTALVVLYFVAPIGGRMTTFGVVLFPAGLIGLAGLLWWQVRSVMFSTGPWLRAIEALATSVPLFLLLFATTYYLIDRHDAQAFGGSLTRLDALYFTVTVFATVGFGDIAAHSQAARAIVVVQMMADLIVIGVGIRVLLGAVRIGLERQERGTTTPADGHEVPTPTRR